jgi:tRNA pseudouridine32 synthase/23S rRNA pseudouridine746 synthase
LSAEEVQAVRAMVIGEDRRLIVLAKPAGLSSQGGRGQANTLDELLYALARHGERPRLVHRLDRDTSGVILAARTKAAAAFLGKAIMARRVEKTYLALVGGGAPEPAAGDIDLPLRREEVGREATMRPCDSGHADAETAQTAYRTLASASDAALVELSPRTGRMHQLRAHMAAIGRPILGDVRYGGALAIRGGPVPRLMLHAQRYGFPHPEGGEAWASAAVAQDMRALAARLDLPLPPSVSGLFRAAEARV